MTLVNMGNLLGESIFGLFWQKSQEMNNKFIAFC